jgi:hypothetical protein
VVRKNSVRRLGNLPFQAIFVMQAVQYRPQFDSATDGELMPVAAGGNLRFVWLGNAGTQRGVRTAPIVMANEFFQTAKVPLILGMT